MVTLKLKRADHRLLTRRQTLAVPTQMADRLYRTALPMLRRDMAAGPFRLIGVGLSGLDGQPARRRRGRPPRPRADQAAGTPSAPPTGSAPALATNSIILGRSLR